MYTYIYIFLLSFYLFNFFGRLRLVLQVVVKLDALFTSMYILIYIYTNIDIYEARRVRE